MASLVPMEPSSDSDLKLQRVHIGALPLWPESALKLGLPSAADH